MEAAKFFLSYYLNFPTINGMLIKNEIKEAKALHLKNKLMQLIRKTIFTTKFKNRIFL